MRRVGQDKGSLDGIESTRARWDFSHCFMLCVVVMIMLASALSSVYMPPSQVLEESNHWGTLRSINEQKQVISERKLSADSSYVSTNSNSSSEERYGGLTRAECIAMYGERMYLPVEKQRIPPLLYSFPGSGNTWSRLLIEYSTGIYTGSVYADKTLLPALPGEFSCNTQVSVVKAHHYSHPGAELRTGVYSRNHGDKGKCKRGGIPKFSRTIFLIRDPFDAIWSEYERRLTGSHVGSMKRATFNWKMWEYSAKNMASEYVHMWTVDYPDLVQHFAKEDVLYIRYEDLKSSETRIQALRNISKFINISTPSDTQLECAFALADNRAIHREMDSSIIITKGIAYNKGTIACSLWKILAGVSLQHGYHMWRNMDCGV